MFVSNGGYEPYPATSPEEDCAAVTAVYGVVDKSLPGFPLKATPNQERARTVSGIENWVQQAASRSYTGASIVPYLKLVYQEWFAQAFEPLRTLADSPQSYHYEPVDASALTTVGRVAMLRDHPAATPFQKRLIQLFLNTRAFLERNFPSPP